MKPGRLDRFDNCGSKCHVQMRDDGQEVRLAAHFCRDRGCEPCQRARGHVVRQNLEELCAKETTRFLTLTMRHSNTPLTDQITRLYTCFKELRRRALWIDNVTGGVAIFETKVADSDGLWHNHLHILITGRWLDARELSKEWHAVTGDSSIIKLKACSAENNYVNYICKYVSKGLDSTVYDNPEKLQEALTALHGRRLLVPFGKWQGINLTDAPAGDHQWIDLGPLHELLERAADGDDVAARYIDAVKRRASIEEQLAKPRPPPTP